MWLWRRGSAAFASALASLPRTANGAGGSRQGEGGWKGGDPSDADPKNEPPFLAEPPRHGMLPAGTPRGLGALWAPGWGARGGTVGTGRGTVPVGVAPRGQVTATGLGGDSGDTRPPVPVPLGALGCPWTALSLPARPARASVSPAELPPPYLQPWGAPGVPPGAAGCRLLPVPTPRPSSFSFCTLGQEEVHGMGVAVAVPPQHPAPSPTALPPPPSSQLPVLGVLVLRGGPPGWISAGGGSTVQGLGAPRHPPRGGHPFWGCFEGPPLYFGVRV